jgi:hypothetical protein
MKLILLLAANWDSALAVAVLTAAVSFTVVKRRWDLLDPVIFSLVTWAEREYGTGTGALKLAMVIQRLYPYIPAVIRPFLGRQKLEDMINNALVGIKKAWEKNPRLIETAVPGLPNPLSGADGK